MWWGLLVLLAPLCAFGEPGLETTRSSVARYWTGEDGLGQNSVLAIAQSPEGYLWLGTGAGLHRFDGLEFERFSRRTQPHLAGERVGNLFLDRSERLWIGTDEGLAVWKDGAFLPPESWWSIDQPGRITQAPDGAIWVATLYSGFVTDPPNAPGSAELNAVAQRVTSVAFPGDGTVIAATYRQGVLRWDPKTGAVEQLRGVRGGDMFSLLARPDGSVLMGGFEGVDRWADGVVRPLSLGPHDGQPIEVMAEGADDSVLLGTPTGVVVLDRDLRLQGRMALTSKAEARALLVDRGGNTWVGFAEAGLARLSPRYVERFEPEGGASGLSVVATVRDADGGLWIADRCQGVSRYEGTRLDQHVGTGVGLTDDCIWTAAEHPAGVMWLGAWSGGVTRWDRRSREIIEVLGPAQGIGEAVLAVHPAADGRVWLGTSDGVFTWRDGELEPVPGLDDVGSLRHVHEAGDGVIWLSTMTGLVRWQDGVARSFGLEQGLLSNRVRHVAEDGRGGLLVATYGGGLHHFDGERATPLDRSRGLSDDFVSHVFNDPYDTVWVSGNAGLARFSRGRLHDVLDGRADSLDPVVLRATDGLPSSECNGGSQASGFVDERGMLHVPTMHGLALVDSAAVGGEPVRPARPVLRGLDSGVRRRTLDAQPDRVELDPGERALEISWTGFHYRAPEGLRFRHRLGDGPWREAGSRRSALYSGLAPGEHRFAVQARVEDGPWSESATLLLVAPRTFAESPWPRLAVVVALILLFLGLIRVQNRRTERIQALVDQRTAELQEANARLAALANEDSLTGVASRRRFEDRLDVEWRTARRSRGLLSLLMVDVDHFKSLNDRLGHPIGDRCLVEIADRLRKGTLRDVDLVARYGGEEFSVLLPGTSLEGAERVARRLLEAVRARPVDLGPAGEVNVTVSIGVAVASPEGEEEAASLVEAADRALYAAKGAGRDRLMLSSDEA